MGDQYLMNNLVIQMWRPNKSWFLSRCSEWQDYSWDIGPPYVSLMVLEPRATGLDGMPWGIPSWCTPTLRIDAIAHGSTIWVCFRSNTGYTASYISYTHSNSAIVDRSTEWLLAASSWSVCQPAPNTAVLLLEELSCYLPCKMWQGMSKPSQQFKSNHKCCTQANLVWHSSRFLRHVVARYHHSIQHVSASSVLCLTSHRSTIN